MLNYNGKKFGHSNVASHLLSAEVVGASINIARLKCGHPLSAIHIEHSSRNKPQVLVAVVAFSSGPLSLLVRILPCLG